MRLIVIAIILFTAIGCEYEGPLGFTCHNKPGTVCVYHDVSVCTPRAKNEEILQNKIDYLAQQGITLSEGFIDNEGIKQKCKACTCTNGKRIYGRVDESQLSAILNEGFVDF